MKGSADVVKAVPATAAVTAEAGQRVSFAIDLDISKTWHVYAHGDTNFIGVDLVPAEDLPLAELTVEYPAGHPGEFFGETVFMISGQEQIKASALVPADLAKGEHKLQFGVTVQACDDKTCLAPVDLPVTVTLTVK
jgi:thiol:disulfide interchange protein DsbD